MKKPVVYIAEPCSQNLDIMPKCKSGWHCGACQKQVVDARKKSQEELYELVSQDPGICITINSDQPAERRSWGWAERTAVFLRAHRFIRTAAVLITACLFLSSCHKKYRITGCPAFKQPESPSTTETK